MNYVLFDEARRDNLLPLTFMRPVADIRFGILTIREKWEHYLNAKTSTLTETYLSGKFPLIKEKENIIINGAICPNRELVHEIGKLNPGEVLVKGETVVAMHVGESDFEKPTGQSKEIEISTGFLDINNTWDIYSRNSQAIKEDFELIVAGRKSMPVPEHCIAINPGNIFIEEGAQVLASTLNATDGPVYIGKDAVVMEGSNIRGPFALCNNATVKMGAKIYGGTTIGPHSKVGGEVNNSVIFGYSAVMEALLGMFTQAFPGIRAGLAVCGVWDRFMLVDECKVIVLVGESLFLNEVKCLSALQEVMTAAATDGGSCSFFAEKFGYRRFSIPFETDDVTNLAISRLLFDFELEATRALVGPPPEVSLPDLFREHKHV